MFFRNIYVNSVPHAKKLYNDFNKTPTGQITVLYLKATLMFTIVGGAVGAGAGMMFGVFNAMEDEIKFRQRINKVKTRPGQWLDRVENAGLTVASDCGTGAMVGAFFGSLPVTYPAIKMYNAVGMFLTTKSRHEPSKPQNPESKSLK